MRRYMSYIYHNKSTKFNFTFNFTSQEPEVLYVFSDNSCVIPLFSLHL